LEVVDQLLYAVLARHDIPLSTVFPTDIDAISGIT
jgi:hypothetical protein